MTTPDQALVSSYDYRLVALSVVIAILAAYAALDLAGRVTSARGRVRFAWSFGGAVAMGIGIWSMHYVGMLAFHVPIPVLYDWPTVLLHGTQGHRSKSACSVGTNEPAPPDHASHRRPRGPAQHLSGGAAQSRGRLRFRFRLHLRLRPGKARVDNHSRGRAKPATGA